MGFAGLFSTSSTTNQFVTNKQIGQSGAGSFALSGDIATNQGDINVVSNDPAIALAAIEASGQNQAVALATLESVGNRFAQVAETSVAGAQNTALNALPLTPEQIAASRGDAAQAATQKNVLMVAALVAASVIALVIINKYKK